MLFDLPPEILLKILNHVDDDTLATKALTCKAWADYAIAAFEDRFGRVEHNQFLHMVFKRKSEGDGFVVKTTDTGEICMSHELAHLNYLPNNLKLQWKNKNVDAQVVFAKCAELFPLWWRQKINKIIFWDFTIESCRSVMELFPCLNSIEILIEYKLVIKKPKNREQKLPTVEHVNEVLSRSSGLDVVILESIRSDWHYRIDEVLVNDSTLQLLTNLITSSQQMGNLQLILRASVTLEVLINFIMVASAAEFKSSLSTQREIVFPRLEIRGNIEEWSAFCHSHRFDQTDVDMKILSGSFGTKLLINNTIFLLAGIMRGKNGLVPQ